MIEFNLVEDTTDWKEKDKITILLEYNHNNNYNKGSLTMTFGDLKKLIGLLNLSVGNNPGNLKLDDILNWLKP